MGKVSKTHLIIHGFALLHALGSFTCMLLGIKDDIVLTVLTITMLIIIALIYDYPADVATAMILLCCFAGFYLGVKGADILNSFSALGRYANVITTFFVTEALGWTSYFIVRRRIRSSGKNN